MHVCALRMHAPCAQNFEDGKQNKNEKKEKKNRPESAAAFLQHSQVGSDLLVTVQPQVLKKATRGFKMPDPLLNPLEPTRDPREEFAPLYQLPAIDSRAPPPYDAAEAAKIDRRGIVTESARACSYFRDTD